MSNEDDPDERHDEVARILESLKERFRSDLSRCERCDTSDANPSSFVLETLIGFALELTWRESVDPLSIFDNGVATLLLNRANIEPTGAICRLLNITPLPNGQRDDEKDVSRRIIDIRGEINDRLDLLRLLNAVDNSAALDARITHDAYYENAHIAARYVADEDYPDCEDDDE
ncbi:MAG: hypothetical protein Q8M31_09175 [Beijerinckiaceae bacterium]|nr:hypothetical protein [Beijerinckiaceae bacterium]